MIPQRLLKQSILLRALMSEPPKVLPKTTKRIKQFKRKPDTDSQCQK